MNPNEPDYGPDPNDPTHIPTAEELGEIVFGPSPSEIAAARRLLREALVPAVQSIIDLAAYGKAERIRLDAAKYITERNLGKVADKLSIGSDWIELLGEITTEVPGPSDKPKE